MPGKQSVWKHVTMSGKTMHFPLPIRRALGFKDDEPAELYLFLEGDRVVIVLEREFPAYLADYRKRRGWSHRRAAPGE